MAEKERGMGEIEDAKEGRSERRTGERREGERERKEESQAGYQCFTCYIFVSLPFNSREEGRDVEGAKRKEEFEGEEQRMVLRREMKEEEERREVVVGKQRNTKE